MAFKNIEQVNEIEYEGYQFINDDGGLYKVTFPDKVGISAITLVSSRLGLVDTIPIYSTDIAKLIKVLQAVYNESK